MGACVSCQAKEISPTTALGASIKKTRVIFPDGSLQEYSAAQLADHRNTISMLGLGETMFLCNADDLEFGGCFVGIGSNQFLQLGQIYFALPRSLLDRPILSDDMARLAIRASSALANTGVVVGMELFEEKKMVKKTNSFAPELTVIVE